MLDETKTSEVRKVFLELLNYKVTKSKLMSDGSLNHPIFTQPNFLIQTYENGLSWHNLFNVLELKEVKDYIIKNSYNWKVTDYMNMIAPNFRLFFIKLIQNYVSFEDYPKLLYYAYSTTTHPNCNIVQPYEIIELMKSADFSNLENNLMSQIKLSNIEQSNKAEGVVVYRCIKTFQHNKITPTTDWFFNKSSAEHYANIRNTKCIVYEALIPFNGIFMIYEGPDKQYNVILDYNKLSNIHCISNNANNSSNSSMIFRTEIVQ